MQTVSSAGGGEKTRDKARLNIGTLTFLCINCMCKSSTVSQEVATPSHPRPSPTDILLCSPRILSKHTRYSLASLVNTLSLSFSKQHKKYRIRFRRRSFENIFYLVSNGSPGWRVCDPPQHPPQHQPPPLQALFCFVYIVCSATLILM